MKRKLLLLVFVLTSFNWIIGQTSCYPDNADYNTGSTNGINFTQTSEIHAQGNNAERGWARFNTSAIPDGDEVLSVELHIYINHNNWAFFKIMSMENDPLSGDVGSVYMDAGDGTAYTTYTSNFPSPDWYVVDLGATAAVDLKNRLTVDWFAIGLYEYDLSGTPFLSCDGWNETNKPYIVVTHSAPPSCLAPSALAESNITANSADLSWTENNTATSWNIKWGVDGFNPDSEGTLIPDLTGNPYALSGLAANTTYDWYVQSDCGSGDKSSWAGPKTFKTLVLAPTPYHEGFTEWTLPEGWTATNWYIDITDVIAPIAGNYIFGELYFSAPLTLTTVNIGSVSAGMYLSFDYAHANYDPPYPSPGDGSGNFVVSISDDYGQNYSILETVDNNSIVEWQYKSYDLSAYAGENVKIKITANRISGNYYLAFDNFSVAIPPSCLTPSTLITSNITLNSADLSWTENGTATSWNIKWGAEGFDPDSEGTLITGLTNNSHALSGLATNASYDWYVQSDCGSGDKSSWAGPKTFATQNISSTPYLEDFESMDIPEGWTTIGWWGIGTVIAISPINGSYYMYGDFYSSSPSKTFTTINIGPVSANMHLSFDYTHAVYNDPYASPGENSGDFVVSISDNYGQNYSILETVDNNTISGWQYKSYDLSAYIGKNVKIKITANPASDYFLAFDNFRVDIPPSCPTPITLTNSNITINSADLSWTENGTATSWNLEWKAGADFTPGNLESDGEATINTTPEHSLTGLTAGTTYYWYVRADCGGDDKSSWTGPKTFTTPAFAPTPYFEGFATTTLPEGWTTTGWWQIGSTSAIPTVNGNYIRNELYGSTPQTITTINIGPVSDGMHLSFDYAHASIYYPFTPPGDGSGNFVVSVSKDYGQTFTDLGTVENNTTAGWQSKSYDLNAYVGEHVKIKITTDRISGRYWLAFDGFNIDIPPSCPAPSALTETNTTAHTADLSWAENGSATSWIVEWKAGADFTPGNSESDGQATVNGSPEHSLTDLTILTVYYWYVRADCGGDDKSLWIGPKTFFTPDILPAPYTQSFETTAPPEGWTTTYWTIGTISAIPAIDGNYIRERFYNYTTSRTFTTINVGPVSADMALSFDYTFANYSYPYAPPANNSGYFSVYISKDLGINYTFLTVISNNTTAGWKSISYDLNAYIGENVKIKIVSNRNSGDYYLAIDNLSIASCLAPISLTESDISGESADLSWTEKGTATNWKVEWKAGADFTPGNSESDGEATVSGSPEHTLTGLSALTTYYWYVKADCGGGDESTWVGPASFTTVCATKIAPWTDDFEAHTATTNATWDNCWSASPAATTSAFRWNLTASGTTPSYYTGPNAAHSGTKFAYTEANSGAAGDFAELYSPHIDVSSLTSPALTFYYYMYGGTIGNLFVDIYDGTAWNNAVVTINGQQQINGNQPWIEEYVNVSAYSGTIRVRFRAERGSGSTGDIAIDDFSIIEAPACPAPKALTESNITVNSADLSWTENGSATSWNLEWNATTDFTPGNSESDGQVTVNTDPEHSLTALTANTTYYWYVKADCGGESDWVGPNTFTTPNYTSVPYFEGFETTTRPEGWTTSGWSIGTTTAIPAIENNYINAYLTSSYTPRTFTTINIGLISADMHLSFYYAHANNNSPYPSPGDGSGNFVVSVSDDYGQSYTDLETVNNNNTATWQYKSYDLSTYVDKYVNIKITANGISGSYYLAFDDFSVAIPPSCLAPSVLTSSNITGGSADLGWTEIGGATNWNIKWAAEDFDPDTQGTLIPNVNNPHTLSGLDPNTTYYWYVQSDCGSGESAWAGPKSFTTYNLSPAPYNQGFATTATPDGWTTAGWTIGTTEAIPAFDGNYIRGIMQYSTPRTFTTINVGPVLADMHLSFYYAHANYSSPFDPPGNGSGNFIVSVSTDYGQSYTDLETVDNNTTAGWQYKSYDLSAYVGKDVKIKITANRTSVTYLLAFDNLSIAIPQSCLDPTTLTESNITLNSADLSWTEIGTATSWNIKWAAEDFDPDAEGTLVSGVTNPYTLSGLAQNTTYYWYVQADCGSGDKSDWVGPKTFTTHSFSPAPYAQDFETTPEGWTTTGWTIGTTTAIPAIDGNYIRKELYNSTPQTFTTINIGPVSADMVLSFYYAHASVFPPYSPPGDASGNFVVSVSTDYGQSYTDLETVNNNNTATWQYKFYDLTVYDGEYVKVKITAKSTSYDSYYLAFDNFSVAVPASCLAPTLLVNSNITENSADLGWTENGSATSWNIKWATVDFDPDTEGTLVSGVSNPYAFSGLTPNTTYYWYVQADCGGDKSDWVGPDSFTTTQLVATLPFTEDFEIWPNSWTVVINGTQTNQWHVGTATAHGGSQAAYISDDAGTSNSYNSTEHSIVHTFIDIAFTEGSEKFNLSFWWKGLGETAYDYMRVYVVETSYLPTAGTLPTSGQIGGNFNQTSDWILAELELPGDYSGTTKRLVFSWRNDGSAGQNPPAAIDDITIRALSALSWTGATSNDWHDAQNWNPARVPTANDNLTISAGLANYPTISSAASCNDIILQSNASGSASLLDNGLLTVNGNATIQRYIKGGGYHFVSVPINGTLTAGMFMNSYLYYYDAAADPQVWAGVGNDPDATITNDQGYMIWYTGNNTTYNFSGSLISGVFTTTTPSSGAVQYQYNLVPNPYPSPIDWDAGTGWTKTKLNNAIYIWNRAKATEANPNGQYASYINGASTNNGSRYIPMGQSFFVETDGGGKPSLTMNNDVRVHSDQPFYKSNQQIPDLMRITSATDNGNDEIVVRLHQGATPEFDREFDASKLFGSASLPQLYSLSADERMLSINTIPLEDEPTVVPVGFEWPNKAEVSFKITELESFDPSINIFLEDLLSGEIFDVREQPMYSFMHDESYEALRFNLHFIKDAVAVGVNEQGLSAYRIWSYDSKVYVSIPALTGEKALIQLIDAQGKVVYEGEQHLSNPEILAVSLTKQVLVARIITGTQVYTQKVFIR